MQTACVGDLPFNMGWALSIHRSPSSDDSNTSLSRSLSDFPALPQRDVGATISASFEPKSGSYPVAGSAAGGFGGPMTGAMRSLT